MKNFTARLLVSAVLGLSVNAYSQDEEPAPSPLYRGGYLAPMGTYVIPDDSRLEDGFGGTLAWGYRSQKWALELVGFQVGLDNDGGGSSDLAGGALNGLLFPFSGLPNLYGILSVGGAELDGYPLPAAGFGNPATEESFKLIRAGGGLGYLFPIVFERYEMAIRAEALYVGGYRDKDPSSLQDVDASRHFNDTVFNIGLQLPLGLKALPPPLAPAVAVVPVLSICADGLDNDGDGLIDHPADPGCSSSDDGDETDPPQCSDGKDNDGDGLVDFPADKGCAAADDNDEVDPCKTPAPGELISLKGCGTGDVIVLKGVNFEFDKSRLTANAKTILDSVASELVAYPEIKIELGGHTDAKGSDEYNQRLSEQRAAAVVKYLKSKGIEADRMTSAGYGESQPVADNETEEGRELNRRVELKVTEGVAAAAAPAVEPAPEAAATDATAAEATVPAADAAPVVETQP